MRRIRVRGWWLLSLLAVGLMVVPWPQWLVEYTYSRGIYPRVQGTVTALSNLAPFAVVDPLLVAAALYVLWRLLRVVVQFRERGAVSAVWEFTRRILRTSACIVVAFVLLWGLNYRRAPLEQSLREGKTVAVTTEDVQRLAEAAVGGTGRTRPSSRAEGSSDYTAVAARLEAPFQRALAQLGMPPLAVAGRPKTSVVLTPFYTAAGITGMVNPIALESIVHPDLLPFERPMTLAHEWAHLAGFADEADASAVAWLACVLGGADGDMDLAYSAQMFVVLESASALPRPVWQTLRAQLSEGVVADIQALAARLTRQQPEVRETAFKVYDGYLRSNRVPDGVRSYSRALRVLVAMAARGLGANAS